MRTLLWPVLAVLTAAPCALADSRPPSSPAVAAPSGPDLVVPDSDGGPITAVGDPTDLSAVPEARGSERLADIKPSAAPAVAGDLPALPVIAPSPQAPVIAPDAETVLRERVRDLLNKAQADLERKDWAAAESEADDAVRLDPKSAGPYEFRSRAYLHLGRYAEAERDALTASLMPRPSAAALKSLAFARFKLGELAEARRAAEEASALDVKDGETFALRAQIEDALGNRPKALELLETASELDSRFYDKYMDAKSGAPIRTDADELGLRRALGLGSWLWRTEGEGWGLLFLFSLAAVLGAGAWVVFRRPTRAPVIIPAEKGPQSATGLLAGKYETLRVIGRGGMGDVLEARDRTLGRPVAIKRMSAQLSEQDLQARDLMIREARTVAALRHPAIVDVYEIIEDPDALYLVFELIRGKTVQQLLAESRRLAPARTLEILKPVCQALEFAHSRGVVHRDLKPSNIMVTEQGHPKLMDFGIARSLSERVAAGPAAGPASRGLDFVRTRTIVGTPLYMAPEMEDGLVCKESDIYSLGICAYEMLTGERPFAEPANAIQKMQMDFLPPCARVPELPAAVDGVLAAALQAAPERRPRRVQEFFDRLESACRG